MVCRVCSVVWRCREEGAEKEGSVWRSWSWARRMACCFVRYRCRSFMWASWLVRFCVVAVWEMRAWARVCGSGDGVERAMVVEARALRAVEPSGVRCARIVESM